MRLGKNLSEVNTGLQIKFTSPRLTGIKVSLWDNACFFFCGLVLEACSKFFMVNDRFSAQNINLALVNEKMLVLKCFLFLKTINKISECQPLSSTNSAKINAVCHVLQLYI